MRCSRNLDKVFLTKNFRKAIIRRVGTFRPETPSENARLAQMYPIVLATDRSY